jgi:hypothetical protein
VGFANTAADQPASTNTTAAAAARPEKNKVIIVALSAVLSERTRTTANSGHLAPTAGVSAFLRQRRYSDKAEHNHGYSGNTKEALT